MLEGINMDKIRALTAAAKTTAFVAAFVLFVPIAFATLMQAAQIIS